MGNRKKKMINAAKIKSGREKRFIIIGSISLFVILLVWGFANAGRFFSQSSVEGRSTEQTELSPRDIRRQPGNDTASGVSNTSGSGGTEEDVVRIKISDLLTKFTYFTYNSDDAVKVKFFGVLDGEGQPHVAFDACDVCYRAKRGYSQQGDRAVCRNCGNRYPIKAIGTENIYGGCWPSFLPVEQRESELIVLTADLDEKSYMF
ncbi:MAG: DUF2318 domain-containing protein [Spirochaetales bacterium]|nr:DUF2318 domain-containing protein [Spirochaetales bacterium]